MGEGGGGGGGGCAHHPAGETPIAALVHDAVLGEHATI